MDSVKAKMIFALGLLFMGTTSVLYGTYWYAKGRRDVLQEVEDKFSEAGWQIEHEG